MYFPRLWPHSINYSTSNLAIDKNKCTPISYCVGLARVNELIDGTICRIIVSYRQYDFSGGCCKDHPNNRDFSTVIITLCDGSPACNDFCKSFDTCLRETVVIPSIICATVVYMRICIACKK